MRDAIRVLLRNRVCFSAAGVLNYRPFFLEVFHDESDFRAAVRVSLCLFCALPAAAWASSGGGEAPRTDRADDALVIQIGVILFAARLGNMAFEKLRLPGVLGELCAGIVIGPSLLGGVAVPWLPGFERGLFHVSELIRVTGTSVSPELYGFCSIASVVLLFLVGVETDLKLFTRYAVAGTLVGLGGVVFSFLAGDLLGMWLLPMLKPGHYSFFDPGCIFLGVMSTATSVSITARILSERKKLETPRPTILRARFWTTCSASDVAIAMG